ncbi:MAG: YtfJ family protein [Smithellaceae bacterium]|nr:YtfJ family protein [Smithellaceae bacterium]
MNQSFLRKGLVVAGCAVIAFVLSTGLGLAATVGQELADPQLRDANDQPATIPDFGTHVITVTYADSSAGDYGDPMNDATKTKNYSKAAYRGLGVANMKDSVAPNFLIRKIVRGKIEKYKSVILTDPDLTLAKTWNLGNCKGKSVYIVVGKDKKLKYIRYTDKSNPWTQADIDSVLKMIEGLM